MRTLLLVVCLVATALPPAPAQAAPVTVTRADDPQPDGCQPEDCSLREAVIAAKGTIGLDTIALFAATFTLERLNNLGDEDQGLTGDLDITGEVTITGAGAGATIIQAGAAPDTAIDRVVEVLPNATVRIAGATICHGRSNLHGGGIYNQGTLTVTGATLSDNWAFNGAGGGIRNDYRLTIAASTLSANQAFQGAGGAISSVGRPDHLRQHAEREHGLWQRRRDLEFRYTHHDHQHAARQHRVCGWRYQLC